MQVFRAELHVHTLLSPCAEVEMVPPLIVAEAISQGINLIAITDHNASANVAAVQKAARGTPLVVLPGMETQTREDVHVVCLFDTPDQLSAWQARIDQVLPAKQNDPEFFGEQFVVDETGEFIRREERLLINSTELSIEELFSEVIALGGLPVPAHVDRSAFGLIANLGFVPSDLPIFALEISRHLAVESAAVKYPQLRGFPLYRSGDVHRLNEFLGATDFTLEAPTVAELILAFNKQAGRSFSPHPMN